MATCLLSSVRPEWTVASLWGPENSLPGWRLNRAVGRLDLLCQLVTMICAPLPLTPNHKRCSRNCEVALLVARLQLRCLCNFYRVSPQLLSADTGLQQSSS